MTREQQLVQLFAAKSRCTEAMSQLLGAVNARDLRAIDCVPGAVFAALLEGLSDENPRIRWWCVQLLDHVADPRAIDALIPLLDDPVARVRRNAAHALGCNACKPTWDRELPPPAIARLAEMSHRDGNDKVRATAGLAISTVVQPATARASRGEVRD